MPKVKQTVHRVLNTLAKSMKSVKPRVTQITSKMPDVQRDELMSACNPTIAFILINIIRLIIMYEIYIAVGISVMPLINLIKEGIVYLLNFISRENLLLILSSLYGWCCWVVESILAGIYTCYDLLTTTMATWITVVTGIFWGMYQQDKGANAAYKVAATNIAEQAKLNKGFIEVIQFAASAERVNNTAKEMEQKAKDYQTKVENAIEAMSASIVMKGAPETWAQWSTKPIKSMYQFIYQYGIIFLINVVTKIVLGTDFVMKIVLNNICVSYNFITDAGYNILDSYINTDDDVVNKPINENTVDIITDKIGLTKIKKQIEKFETNDIESIAREMVFATITEQSGVEQIACPNAENISEITAISEKENADALNDATKGVVQDINAMLDATEIPPTVEISLERQNSINNTPELERTGSIPRATQLINASTELIIDNDTKKKGVVPPAPLSWYEWFKHQCLRAVGRRGGRRRATRRKPKKLSGRKRRQVGRGRRTKHKNRRTRRM
jgi:hypothetical protein